MSRRLYNYDEAAVELRVEKTWLQRHIKRLPHVKFGRDVLFTDADLDAITELHHHKPERAAEPVSAGGQALATLRPLPARSGRRTA